MLWTAGRQQARSLRVIFRRVKSAVGIDQQECRISKRREVLRTFGALQTFGHFGGGSSTSTVVHSQLRLFRLFAHLPQSQNHAWCRIRDVHSRPFHLHESRSSALIAERAGKRKRERETDRQRRNRRGIVSRLFRLETAVGRIIARAVCIHLTPPTAGDIAALRGQSEPAESARAAMGEWSDPFNIVGFVGGVVLGER